MKDRPGGLLNGVHSLIGSLYGDIVAAIAVSVSATAAFSDTNGAFALSERRAPAHGTDQSATRLEALSGSKADALPVDGRPGQTHDAEVSQTIAWHSGGQTKVHGRGYGGASEKSGYALCL